MVSLSELLLEANGKPKAIFMAGPAGSGKSTIIKELIPSYFTTLNIDDEYEKLLTASGMGMAQKDFNPEELSQAAKFMSQAQKKTREKFITLSQELKDIIIDGTGAATRPLLKKDDNLKALGYDTFMIMLNVSPITSLKRNLTRNRQLLPTIITKTWKSVNTNIDIFREAFGNDFILIDNDPADAEKDFDPKEIKIRFFDTTKAKGKPKTPEQLAKKAKEVEQLNQDIIDLIQIEREYDTLEEAKAKIDRFLNE